MKAWRRRLRRRRSPRLILALVVVALPLLLASGAIASAAPQSRTTPPAPAPSVTPPAPTLPAATTIGGVDVSGLTEAQARVKVRAAWQGGWVHITVAGHRFAARPAHIGQHIALDRAITAAFALPATDGSVVLKVTVQRKPLAKWEARIAKRVVRKPRNAVILFRHNRVVIQPDLSGIQMKKGHFLGVIAAKLERVAPHGRNLGTRKDVIRERAAKITAKSLPPAIKIDRSAHKLTLYVHARVKHVYSVAVGMPQYPTPLGHFTIVDMQRHPWWYPPTYDSWAKGAKPVPPGPNNPLGTRWMGLSAPGVGIHGTDEPASIGYSESHGCIRMHVPDAEKLFEQVRVGTPVFIVR